MSKALIGTFNRVKDEVISNFQVAGMCAMSFMHGAQDGQKFIGIFVIYIFLLKNMSTPEFINPKNNAGTILLVAIIMFFGVSVGGKKIVQNIGCNVARLTKRQALCSDIVTSITLFIASLKGLPVSTSHVKTVSIIGVGKTEKTLLGGNSVMQVFKAWIFTFPVCMGISYVIAKLFFIFS